MGTVFKEKDLFLLIDTIGGKWFYNRDELDTRNIITDQSYNGQMIVFKINPSSEYRGLNRND